MFDNRCIIGKYLLILDIRQLCGHFVVTLWAVWGWFGGKFVGAMLATPLISSFNRPFSRGVDAF